MLQKNLLRFFNSKSVYLSDRASSEFEPRREIVPRKFLSSSSSLEPEASRLCESWPPGYKKLFMLNSTEHGISTAHKIIMLKNKDFSYFQTLRCCIYHANKC